MSRITRPIRVRALEETVRILGRVLAALMEKRAGRQAIRGL